MHQQQSWLYPIIQTRENTEIQTYNVRINTRPYLMDSADHNKEKYRNTKRRNTRIQKYKALCTWCTEQIITRRKKVATHSAIIARQNSSVLQKKRVKNFFKLLILIWLEYWQIVSQKCWGLKQMYKKEYPFNPFVELTLSNSNDPHCLYGPRIIANLNWKGGCKKAGKMRKVGKISNLVGGEGGVGKYRGGKQKRQLQ